MDYNIFKRKKIKELYEVYQSPDGQVVTKLPGKLSTNRWNYMDNPINGIGEKEYRDKIFIWDNTSPWERHDSNA